MRRAFRTIPLPMEWLGLLLVAVLAGGAACALVRLGPPKPAYPVGVRRNLFTPAERSLLTVLERVVERDERVFGKVALREIAALDARLRTGLPARADGGGERRFDFVVLRAHDQRVTCLVDVDDGRPQKPLGQNARGALAAAGVQLVRFTKRDAYASAEVRTALRSSSVLQP